MNVDISKIKPGDKVTVEATVLSFDTVFRSGQGVQALRLSFEEGCNPYCVRLELARSHTPAPREINVGDMVTAGPHDDALYEVIGADGDTVWLKNKGGYRFNLKTRCVCHCEPRS